MSTIKVKINNFLSSCYLIHLLHLEGVGRQNPAVPYLFEPLTLSE